MSAQQLSGCAWCGAGSAEEDLKILQQPGLPPEERLAARLRISEKRILQGTLDAVRRFGPHHPPAAATGRTKHGF